MTQHRPNTFIVGAPKCGTTSLHEYLAQHPQAFVSKTLKEPNYFNPDLKVNEDYRKRNLHDYLAQFNPAQNQPCVGDASPWYLFSTEAAQRIHDFDPNAKIIMMLRNPIDAAYSLHGQLIWSCNEDILDFQQALDAETDRARGRRIPSTATSPSALLYTQVYSFHHQVQRYLQIFPPSQLKIILFDDFSKNTPRVYRDTLAFLNLPLHTTDLRAANPAKPVSLPINRFLAKHAPLRKAIHRLIPLHVQRKIADAIPHILPTINRPAKIPHDLRNRLSQLFKQDVTNLSCLLKKDLTPWLTC